MRKKITWTISLLLGSLFFVQAQNYNNTPLLDKVDSLLVNTTRPFNGVIFITENGLPLVTQTIGYSDLVEKTPMKIDDQFVVGSISKQFTAAIVLREYDKGRIDLHISIRHYLPDLSQNWADTVTVHHLLTHLHGIVALDKPTLFPVGTQYDYSQIGYDLLAKIVEETSGQPFSKVSADLFEKCGMKNTFHPDVKNYKNLVKGYVENVRKELEYTDKSLAQYPAAGAFISTAEDLELWNQLLFGGKILDVNTFNLMISKQQKAIREHPIFGHTEYGYGITVGGNNGLIQWGQTGYAPGFASMNFYFPQNDLSVIVLENVNYDTSDIKKMYFYQSNVLDIVKDYLLHQGLD